MMIEIITWENKLFISSILYSTEWYSMMDVYKICFFLPY